MISAQLFVAISGIVSAYIGFFIGNSSVEQFLCKASRFIAILSLLATDEHSRSVIWTNMKNDMARVIKKAATCLFSLNL